MSNEMVTVDCRNLATSIADNGKPQFVFKLRGRAEHEVICGKSIVVFHCSACLLQDFCNLLHTSCICAKLPKIKFYQTAILAIFTHNFGHSMLPNLLLTHNVKILITNQHIHVHRSDKAKCIQQGVHTSRRLHHRKSGHTV